MKPKLFAKHERFFNKMIFIIVNVQALYQPVDLDLNWTDYLGRNHLYYGVSKM